MKLFKYISAIFAGLALASCSDEIAPETTLTDGVPSELTLTLVTPDYAVTEIGTRADADATIRTLTVLCYSKTGTFLSQQKVSTGFSDKGSNRFEVTVPIDKNTVSLQFVANMDVPAGISNLSTHFTSDPAACVMWGKAELKDLLATPVSSRTVALLRQNAKVSVKNNASGFTLSQFGVYNTAVAGSVAPTGLSIDPSAPTIKSGEGYGYNVAKGEAALVNSSQTVAVFETAKDETVDANKKIYKTRGRVIIKGSYAGVTGYYVVAFRTQGGSGYSETPGAYTYTPVDVIRNHHYIVTVSEVRGPGWPTLAEALKAEADNRLTALVSDINESVNSISANSDYMLGVSSELNIASEATVANATIVSSFPADGVARITLSDDAAWIKTEGFAIGNPSKQVSASEGRCPTAYVYTLAIPVEANTAASSRTGHITVTSGGLTRTITVIQEARDYRHDPDRKVILTIDNNTVTGDYYSWIENTLHGVASSDFYQNGILRSDGLHFPAVPAYTAVYKIPVKTGDSNATVTSGSIFSLSTSGGYYQISMAAQSSPGITTATFSVKNASGVTIIYPLYRTGYMHQLTSSHASYQREGGALSGWYYYEVVKVGNYWTLDRNLGASSNYPYITTSAPFNQHPEAVGGYFKVSTSKSSNVSSPVTVISNLGVSKFVIPTRADLQAMSIGTVDITPSGAERTIVAKMATASPSKLSVIYLPHGGYYEGDVPRYETHANLWTRTLVSGNQGFSVDSPDFGYWYQYLDVYNTSVNYSNMRMANGSTGEAPSSESIYKYMPLRLIWQ